MPDSQRFPTLSSVSLGQVTASTWTICIVMTPHMTAGQSCCQWERPRPEQGMQRLGTPRPCPCSSSLVSQTAVGTLPTRTSADTLCVG